MDNRYTSSSTGGLNHGVPLGLLRELERRYPNRLPTRKEFTELSEREIGILVGIQVVISHLSDLHEMQKQEEHLLNVSTS